MAFFWYHLDVDLEWFIMTWCWHELGMILTCVWCDFVMNLALCWDNCIIHFGIMLSSCCHHYCIILQSFLHNFGTGLGYSWDTFENIQMHPGPIWHTFWFHLGQLVFLTVPPNMFKQSLVAVARRRRYMTNTNVETSFSKTMWF